MVPQLPGPSCGGDRILAERWWGVSLAPAAPCHRLSLPPVSVLPQAYIGSSSSFARDTKPQKATRLDASSISKTSQHVGLITPSPSDRQLGPARLRHTPQQGRILGPSLTKVNEEQNQLDTLLFFNVIPAPESCYLHRSLTCIGGDQAFQSLRLPTKAWLSTLATMEKVNKTNLDLINDCDK